MQDLDAVCHWPCSWADEYKVGQKCLWQPSPVLLAEQPRCAWLIVPAKLSQPVKQVVGKYCPATGTSAIVSFGSFGIAHRLLAVTLFAMRSLKGPSPLF